MKIIEGREGGVRKCLDLMTGFYENNGGLTKRGSTKIYSMLEGGQRKFTAKGRGVYEKFWDFD